MIKRDEGPYKKIKEMQKDGARELHVLSDFDRTLTKPRVRGKEVSSLISVLRDGNYLTSDYAPKAHALFEHYHAIEMNPDIQRDEKKKKMREWWLKHFELLISSGLKLSDIKHAMESRGARLRDGAKDFFALLKENEIPLVIMSSSGLGKESIKLFLEREHIPLETIHIISNQYIWDATGTATGIKQPIIHGMNKDETVVKDFPDIYQHIKDRKNVILLGDHEGDLDMISGFSYDTLLTIGFTDEDHFDTRFPTDSSMDPVIKIIKEVIE